MENANDLIQSVDPNGTFLYVNRAWKETMGYADEEIASLKVFDVISPACQSHCSLLFQQIMSGKSIPRMEVQFTAKDGRIVELEGSINCSFVDGKPVVTRGIFRDITERKAMERSCSRAKSVTAGWLKMLRWRFSSIAKGSSSTPTARRSVS